MSNQPSVADTENAPLPPKRARFNERDVSTSAGLLSTCSIAIRFFQIYGTLLLFHLIVTFGTLLILSPDLALDVLRLQFRNFFAAPQTSIGASAQFGAMMAFAGPPLFILLSASVGNAERLGLWLALLLVLGLLIGPVLIYLSNFELLAPYGDELIYSIVLTLFFSGIVLLYVAFGLFKGATAERTDLADIRANAGNTLFGGPMRNTFAIPQFVNRLGLRGVVASGLFVISSLALASALLPIVVPSMQLKNLFQLNRATCMAEPASLRLECFQSAMREDIMLLPFYALGGFLLWYAVYRLVLWGARRLSITSLDNLIARDRRNPVAFFRSFSDEQVALPGPQINVMARLMRVGTLLRTLDNIVLTELSDAGPVVALGDPSKTTVPYGAARRYSSDLDWREIAFKLIDDAKHIVLVFGDTPSIWEEFEEVLTRGRADQTLFVLPPVSSDERRTIFQGTRDRLRSIGVGVEGELTGAPIGFYLNQGRLRVIGADTPSEDHYLTMVRSFRRTKVAEESGGGRRWLLSSPYSASLVVILCAMLAWRFYPVAESLLPHSATGNGNAVGIIDIVGASSNGGPGQFADAELVDMKLQPDGDGAIAYLRRPQQLPEIVWFSSAWEVERVTQVTTPTRALSVTPAATKNDLLLVGDDGRVCVEASVRHPLGVDSYRIRWQVSCFTADGRAMWTATSDSNESDVANGIAMRRDGGVNLIKPGELVVLGLDGHVVRSLPFGSPANANNASFALDGGLIAFEHSLNKEENSTFQRIGADGQAEWKMPLVGLQVSGAIVRVASKGGYIFGVTDFDIDDKRDGTRGYVGSITPNGTLKWLTRLDIEDAKLVDILEADGRIHTVLAHGNSFSSGARSFVVSLSYDGEVLATSETPRGKSRLPEGLMISANGYLIVYGVAKNVPARATTIEAMTHPDKPWIGRVVVEEKFDGKSIE